MAPRRYLIIGDGAAGTSAAQHLRSQDPAGLIAIYADDPHPAYFRAALTNYLLGELTEDQLWAVPPSFYQDNHIHRALGRATFVDHARRLVHLSSGGQPVPYDALLIATGARARPATFPGADLPGVMTMRTLQDARQMMDMLRLGQVRRAVVVGGGPLGLEWAQGLKLRGVHVTLLLRERRFMAGVLDDVASDLLLSRLRQSGVEVGVAEEVASALPDATGRLGAIATKSGHTLPCEVCAIAIGVICNSDFLSSSGVALGKTGGIVVDDRLRASVPGVFAAGDVAEHQGRTLQLWEPARSQARVAGHNMTGADLTYRPGAHYSATRLYDLDFASVGVVSADPGAQHLIDFPRSTGRISYRKVSIKNGRLIGALMLGEREERVRQRGRAFKKLIDEGTDISSIQDNLLDPAFDLGGWLRSQALLQKPVAAPTGAPSIASPAGMRKTQAIAAFAGTTSQPSVSAQTSANVNASANANSHANANASAPPYLEIAGRRYALGSTVTSIGRDPKGQVPIEDRGASFLHAQISQHGDDHYLRDMGSKNGTWVNAAQVTIPHQLRSGDRIRIGTTEIVFHSTSGSSAMPDQRDPTGPTGVAPHLQVRTGHALGLTFALSSSPATLGRDPANPIRLDDISVSSRHAVFYERGGHWHVTDQGSTNGTFWRGERLAPGREVMLQEGDMLAVGQVSMLFSTRPLAVAPLMSAWREPRSSASAAPRVCAGCSRPLVLGARFCNSCGFPVPAGAS